MTVWNAVMNIAGVNANIILHAVNPQLKLMRREFLITLGRSLIDDQLKWRMLMNNIPRELKSTIRRICNVEDQPEHPNNPGPTQRKRQRCHLCPRSRDLKHSTSCYKCYKGVCKSTARKKLFVSTAKTEKGSKNHISRRGK
ncbi:uncharacterized protein LOC120352758 [Nilaparvata lugens]|uniref:uncharacterized protein LOC120352758 n=1 Tax=Nilaparvata lugens TaxID=108931 RepID=UPI00193DBC13|nr:uncharacterized protein LOC120352758 [Nilaparvata lugens]